MSVWSVCVCVILWLCPAILGIGLQYAMDSQSALDGFAGTGHFDKAAADIDRLSASSCLVSFTHSFCITMLAA